MSEKERGKEKETRHSKLCGFYIYFFLYKNIFISFAFLWRMEKIYIHINYFIIIIIIIIVLIIYCELNRKRISI